MASEKEGELGKSGWNIGAQPDIYKVLETAIMKIWAIGNPNSFLPA
jgi:hypothetical protein